MCVEYVPGLVVRYWRQQKCDQVMLACLCTYVSEYDGGCFSIFDPKGQKIHTVGNLNRPLGVALDPQRGSLYVLNFDSNNVLKYIM